MRSLCLRWLMPLVLVVLLLPSCSGDDAANTMLAATTTTAPTATTTNSDGAFTREEIETVVTAATDVAVNVAAGLNEDDPELFLAQFQPGAKVTDSIAPTLTSGVGWFHSNYRQSCVWGVRLRYADGGPEVFVNDGGSLTKGTCTGFYESVEGAPESLDLVRHLPMKDGLATGLMHRLQVDVIGEHPEETAAALDAWSSLAGTITEEVESARSFGGKFVEAWQSGDPSSVAALYGPEGFREDGFAALSPTHEGTIEWLAQLYETYDGVGLSVEDLYASGLGPAAIYAITMSSAGSECTMRLASVWDLDENGLIDHEYVFYDPDTVQACAWWD